MHRHVLFVHSNATSRLICLQNGVVSCASCDASDGGWCEVAGPLLRSGFSAVEWHHFRLAFCCCARRRRSAGPGVHVDVPSESNRRKAKVFCALCVAQATSPVEVYVFGNKPHLPRFCTGYKPPGSGVNSPREANAPPARFGSLIARRDVTPVPGSLPLGR